MTGDESIIAMSILESVFIWNLNEGACTDQDSCATGALVGFSNSLIEMVELSGNSTVKVTEMLVVLSVFGTMDFYERLVSLMELSLKRT